MKHAAITGQVIGCAFDVHNELRSGSLEQVYENALAIALLDRGMNVVQQAPLQVRFRGHVVGDYRPDLLVESVVIVEIKAQASISPANEAQLLNYLRASGIEVGLLLNFGRSVEYLRRVL
jgi:GxxExxY protein